MITPHCRFLLWGIVQHTCCFVVVLRHFKYEFFFPFLMKAPALLVRDLVSCLHREVEQSCREPSHFYRCESTLISYCPADRTKHHRGGDYSQPWIQLPDGAKPSPWDETHTPFYIRGLTFSLSITESVKVHLSLSIELKARCWPLWAAMMLGRSVEKKKSLQWLRVTLNTCE